MIKINKMNFLLILNVFAALHCDVEARAFDKRWPRFVTGFGSVLGLGIGGVVAKTLINRRANGNAVDNRNSDNLYPKLNEELTTIRNTRVAEEAAKAKEDTFEIIDNPVAKKSVERPYYLDNEKEFKKTSEEEQVKSEEQQNAEQEKAAFDQAPYSGGSGKNNPAEPIDNGGKSGGSGGYSGGNNGGDAAYDDDIYP